METSGSDNDVCFNVHATLGANTSCCKRFDFVGDHAGFTFANSCKQVAIGNKRNALLPWAVLRSEVLHVVTLWQEFLYTAKQQILHYVGVLHGGNRNLLLVEQCFASNNFVHPFFFDLKLTQRVCKVVHITAGYEIRW